jgi:hypothetical protein
MRHLAIIVIGVCAASSMACSNPVFPAADIHLNGTISDSATHAGIPGAIVRLYEAEGFTRANILGSTVSDASGHYALTVHIDRCPDALIALGVDAFGYQTVLRGYGFDPPDRSPQCLSSPQTLNVTLHP